MRRCQQCGHENEAEDVFCANCGTRLSEEPRTFAERPATVPPAAPSTDYPLQQDQEEDWRMSSLGPPPERKRRRWLWVLLGLLLLCVVLCVAAGVFLNTDIGMEWFEGVATDAAERATEAAR